MSSDLHTTALGDRGPPVVFCHGLFGQGRNWTQHRQGAGRRAPGAAGRHAPPRPVAVERPLRLPRRRRPGGRAAVRGRPGRAGRALDGRQDRDGAGAAAPRAGRAARASSTSRRWPTTASSEFAGYIDAMQGLDLDALAAARRGRRRAARRRCRTRPCAASCCRTCAATATAGAGRPTSSCSGRDLDADRRLARGRAGRRRAVRRAGAVGRRRRARRTCTTTTPRRWTAGSPATAGSPSRAPGTGCTPSSRRSSSRCCGSSSAEAAASA